MTTEKLYYTFEEINSEVVPVIKRMLADRYSPSDIGRIFNKAHGNNHLTVIVSPRNCETTFLYMNQPIYSYKFGF